MSREHIFRNGDVATQPFSSSLTEIDMPASAKRRGVDPGQVRQKVLEQAKEEGFAAGRQEGFEVGRKSGYQAGFDQAHTEAGAAQAELLRQFAADLQKVHERLEAQISKWFADTELEVENISVEIAEKLLGAQLHLDRSYIVEAAKEALQLLTEASQARIRVNPFDSVILSNSRDALLAATASLRGIEIVDDASIQGGCIIETDRGAVDSTIETRLKLLHGALSEEAA